MRGWEKILHTKTRHESRSCNTHSRQNRLKNKGHKEGERTLYNYKKINIKRRFYTHQIICIQYIKQILTYIKGEIDGNIIIVGGFNNSLTSLERYRQNQ